MQPASLFPDAINDKKNSIYVVGMEGNASINFAGAIRGGIQQGGKKYDAIAVDFKDFNSISGKDAAVSSLVNYAFVHEVFHLYPKPGLEDTVSGDDSTGPVENKVNEIRYVRGDLLRASYSITQDSESFGSMYFGNAKTKNGQVLRNSNGGIKVESKKIINFNLRMTGQ